MTQAYTQLVESIQGVRQSWRQRRFFEGLLLTVAAVAGALLVTAGIDHLFGLNSFGRAVLAAVVWTAGIGCAMRYIIRPCFLTPHSDDYFAALIENRHPHLRNRVINALQLGREETPRAPRLVEAIVSQGAAATDEVDPGRAVSEPALRRFSLALLIVAALLGAYAFLGGPGARVSMARVLMPTADILPYTHTVITLTKPRDYAIELLEGEPLALEVMTVSRVASDASINWTDSQGNLRSLRMTRLSDQTLDERDPNSQRQRVFSYTFPSIDSSFGFYITAGDARSRDINVTVMPRPRVSGMSVSYRYPSYTGLAAREVKEFDGHLRGFSQTKAVITVRANTRLHKLAMMIDGGQPLQLVPTKEDRAWTTEVTLTTNGVYYFKLTDRAGSELSDPGRYTITLQPDAPPQVGFARPGRDVQLRPDEALEFLVVAQDDLGVGAVKLMGRMPNAKEPVMLHEWPAPTGEPRRRLDLPIKKTVAEMGLKPGDRMEYWAAAWDRNDVAPQPGYGESRRFGILVLTPEQAAALLDRQINEYAKAITELIRLQRINRNETAGQQPAPSLIERQALIRRSAMMLADAMEKNAFPLKTMQDELRDLANQPMAKVISFLESYRDATDLETSKAPAAESVPLQDQIIEALESMLKRLNRDDAGRTALKRLEKFDQAQHKEAASVLGKMVKDLDKFLAEQRELNEKLEKMVKREGEEATGEDARALADAKHLMDRWKQWSKDSVDAIAKLPEGFVKDSALREHVQTVFEEIEKKARPATGDIVTPMEEGAMLVGTKVKEDLELWLPEFGDAVRLVMEDPMGGKYEVPPYTLPEKLQDLVGDLIEDMGEFDEKADDVTGTQGGNFEQAGWDIADGPIGSTSAVGKTGNQMPNDSEQMGRSGDGRRGKSSGQTVGSEMKGLEGRPTPARLTNDKYDENIPKEVKQQLDPRGATGGGMKTGTGTRGLQGGTKPDYTKQNERLEKEQQQLREKLQQVAKELQGVGRSSSHVNRAMELMDGSASDLKDQRYDDAARKRKLAIGEMKSEHAEMEQGVSLSLQKAQNLPPEMREQISAGAQQALPEGFEDLVGAYYKALSGAGNENSAEKK